MRERIWKHRFREHFEIEAPPRPAAFLSAWVPRSDLPQMWRPRRCLLALLLVLLGATAWARDPDPYNLLDISRGAGDPEIKRAYRKLSLRFHPDKQQGKSAEEAEKAANKFMSIQKAYETLSDPEKRRNYDMTGFADPKDAWKDQRCKRRKTSPEYQPGRTGWVGLAGECWLPWGRCGWAVWVQSARPNRTPWI